MLGYWARPNCDVGLSPRLTSRGRPPKAMFPRSSVGPTRHAPSPAPMFSRSYPQGDLPEVFYGSNGPRQPLGTPGTEVVASGSSAVFFLPPGTWWRVSRVTCVRSEAVRVVGQVTSPGPANLPERLE